MSDTAKLIKPLEWTNHEVDGCPVPTSAFVDVRYRDGDFSMCVAAGGLPWSKTGTYCDIVAFRIVPPPNVKSAAADDIKAAYFEGFLAGCDQGENTGKLYAEKNWPFSQAQSDHERALMEASAINADLDEEDAHVIAAIERELGNWECDGPDELPTTVAGLIEAERAIYRAAAPEQEKSNG